jgi:hypothetical protein
VRGHCPARESRRGAPTFPRSSRANSAPEVSKCFQHVSDFCRFYRFSRNRREEFPMNSHSNTVVLAKRYEHTKVK